ncbi:MAG TPA: DUF2203 domain-containing protein [Clostridia bacterium]|nr:DUF2203 domain-containing protein [Clostridia bacterium]
MANQFHKHYTVEEARALLPRLRQWLKRLSRCRLDLQRQEEALLPLRGLGNDLGGPVVNKLARTVATTQHILFEFYRREIQVKDFERGLVDFPALRHGKEVFLCWEMAEEDICYWHDLDSGYAGREPL